MKNKLNKKYPQDGPTAMKDEFGNLLTNKNEILEHTVKHYNKVLENRPIKEYLKTHQKEREELAIKRMTQASKLVTSDWTEEDLDDVLKGLKNYKS